MKILLKVSILLLFLTSCQSNGQAFALPISTAPQPTETLSPQIQVHQNEITSIWETSIHAQGLNPVKCADCHLTKNGIVLEEVSWRNEQTGQYEAVSNISSLCDHCHEVQSVKGVHKTLTCTDCHDPHQVEASCTESGCHSDIPTVFYEIPSTPTGGHPNISSSFCGGPNCHSVATAVANTIGSIHGPAHAQVSCLACHDASHMQASPSPDNGKWLIWQEVESNGELVNEPYISHDIQLEVDCARCHFESNPWGLNLVTGSEFKK